MVVYCAVRSNGIESDANDTREQGRKMPVPVLECFLQKAEYLPPAIELRRIYVRPNELANHENPDQWEYESRTFHVSAKQAFAVETQGFHLVEVRKRATA